MTRPVRPPAAYVHGLDGPTVVVPARVAAWLERHAHLTDLRNTHRGADPEVSAVLVALGVAAAAWRSTATGTELAATPEPERPCQQMSTTQAADLLHIGDRAIRKAIAEGRLPARRAGARWVLTREDVEHYRAGHAAA